MTPSALLLALAVGLAVGLAIGRWFRASAVTRDAHLALAEREALAKRAVDALRVIIWAADGDEVLRLSRGGALPLLGLRSGQLVGTQIAAVEERGNLASDGPAPDGSGPDGPDELAIIREVFHTGRRQVRTNRHESAAGAVVYLRMEYSPLFAPDGAVEYVCGCGVDVTDEETRARRTHREAIRAAARDLAPA